MTDGTTDNNSEPPTGWAAFRPLSRLVLGGMILLALLGLSRMRFSIPNVDATSTGTFVENGAIPFGEAGPRGLRSWSSWAGSDNNRGAVVIGPFMAPVHLGVFASGYPNIGGNRLCFENATTGEEFDPGWDDFAESWARLDVVLPKSWMGDPVLLHATDDAAEWGGWLGVSEPFQVPWVTVFWNGTPARLCAFLLIGVYLSILLLGARVVAQKLAGGHAGLVLVLAVAIVAAAGYVMFWMSFLHHAVGALMGWALPVVAVGLVIRKGLGKIRRRDSLGVEWMIPFWLTVGAGVFYLGGWQEFSLDSRMSYLAQHRFSASMPADNAIPQIFAARLAEGASPRHLMGDWLSSDRPPLQAGWVLMFRPVMRWGGFDFDTLAQCAGLWFQLLWVPALWCFLRSLKTSVRASAVIIAAVVPTGFLFLSSVYVWPKLGAAAFALGAYACWFLVSDQEIERRMRFGIGGALAALAWLSHGGVAFSFLALIPIALGRWRSSGWRAWRSAAVVFLVGVVPWVIYQKCYDPPGNRLLKWHLAGVIPLDDRGFGETMVDSYRELTWDEWVQSRMVNFKMIFAGPWREVRTFNFAHPQSWRDSQAFAFFCFGWWNLGWIALPWVCFRSRQMMSESMNLITAVAWALSTFAVWVVLMFISGSVFVHQGSYTPMIVLFALLALLLWRLHPLVFLVVATLQGVIFTAVWAAKPEHWAEAAWNYDAVALMVFAMLFLIAVAILSGRREAGAT